MRPGSHGVGFHDFWSRHPRRSRARALSQRVPPQNVDLWPPGARWPRSPTICKSATKTSTTSAARSWWTGFGVTKLKWTSRVIFYSSVKSRTDGNAPLRSRLNEMALHMCRKIIRGLMGSVRTPKAESVAGGFELVPARFAQRWSACIYLGGVTEQPTRSVHCIRRTTSWRCTELAARLGRQPQ
jgi:hypothetical protein